MIKKLNKNGYNLHIIKTTKFKTISIKIAIWNELKKEELALRNILVDNLLFSSKKYNNSRKMAIKKQELYSANLFTSTYRNGTQLITEINMSCIEDKYTEKGNLKKSIEFMFECLMNPNIKNNAFDLTAFNITKKRLEAAIKSESQNPSYYCYQRFKEMIGNKKMLTTSILGTIKQLEEITPESLYNYYKTLLINNHIDIFVIGNVNTEEIEKEIDNNLKLNKKNIAYTNTNTSYEKEFSEKEEPSKFNQSKLIMGASTKKLTNHEKKYESIIYNIILGNSPNSKLFQNVREKKSYAYTISSSTNRLDGILTISAGISYKNYNNTKTEILKQIENLKKGDFKEKDIKNAKEIILSILKEVNDSPWSMLDHYNNLLYFETESIEKQKEEIKKITKQSIINVAKKINIDTIFLLKEDLNEEISN